MDSQEDMTFRVPLLILRRGALCGCFHFPWLRLLCQSHLDEMHHFLLRNDLITHVFLLPFTFYASLLESVFSSEFFVALPKMPSSSLKHRCYPFLCHVCSQLPEVLLHLSCEHLHCDFLLLNQSPPQGKSHHVFLLYLWQGLKIFWIHGNNEFWKKIVIYVKYKQLNILWPINWGCKCSLILECRWS